MVRTLMLPVCWFSVSSFTLSLLLLMVPSLLILTDFFQGANQALDYASNLADPLGARLVLLHVRRNSVLDPEMQRGVLSNLSREAINLVMNDVARQLAVPVVAEVGYGGMAAAVADAVSRHHPELIVLGRPEYSTTPAEMVETTSLDILRAAPYPMLLVPHDVVSSSPPTRLLLAVDGQPFDLGEHAGVVHRLLAELRASLTVLYVTANADFGKKPPRPWKRWCASACCWKRRRLRCALSATVARK
ncbi:universal stress protein [Hymenobacter radiodurans]|uniref:universal stress protein n=1 Tax=Hymenobacter radiodurans TaxID=2496028 RepID=UPI0014044F44|nr:universal stress protein [Hymenobacter radiodurans]